MTNDSDDGPAGDEGPVLSPHELDISDDENVVEIDDGRYVISPGGGTPRVPGSADDEGEDSPDGGDASGDEGGATGDDALDLDAVHDWLGAYLSEANSSYSFDVTASFQGKAAQKALFSNDVVTAFENLVVWYAHHAGGETPVEDVIGILLMESNVVVRYPADSVRAFAEAAGLTEEDSIDDFLEAVDEADGITFPPGEDV